MIDFSHVYKTYPGPVHALKNVDLKIRKGEFVYLTGPSGAGKTTLFKMLSAFDRPTHGSVKVMDYDICALDENSVAEYRRKIGVVYQDFKLLKERSIAENVALPLEILGKGSKEIETRTKEILNQVGLTDKVDQLPEQLSGGEQQRAALARALIHHPTILIADEPTGNLDPALSHEIINLIEKVNAQGTTVVVATHDHDLVRKRRKRRIELNQGELRKDYE